MLNFGQMKANLNLLVMASLIPTDVGYLLNLAQDEEADQYEWSWRYTSSTLYTFAPYSTGTITLTPGSITVQGTGTAWTSAFNGWQASFGPSGIALQIANIINPTTLALSQPYLGVAQSNISYNLRQSYYVIQGALEVLAIKNVVYLQKTSREVLNVADPQRLAVGGNPALEWAPAPYAYLQSIGLATGLGQGSYQVVEMWPVPSAAVPYVVEYRRGATPMTLDTDIPLVASSVLQYKVAMLICQANYASTGSTQWDRLSDKYQKLYLQNRDDAQYADRKRTLSQNSRDPRPTFGLDVLDLHDV